MVKHLCDNKCSQEKHKVSVQNLFVNRIIVVLGTGRSTLLVQNSINAVNYLVCIYWMSVIAKSYFLG